MVEKDNVVIGPSGSGYIVGKSSVMAVKGLNGKKQVSTSPKLKPENEVDTSDKIAFWGVNNDFPQQVIKDVEASTILAPKLAWLARALHSGGITYGVREVDEDGEKLVPKSDPRVDAFLKDTKIHIWLNEACKSFYYFRNVFPMMLKDGNDKIGRIRSQQAEYCRVLKRDAKGKISHVGVNAQWEEDAKYDDPETLKIPAIDPLGYPMDEIKERKLDHFIYPIKDHSPGKSYYALAEWESARKSGWYELAQAIPKFKSHILKNQATIKYLIVVADWYWKAKYKDWDEKTQDEQLATYKEELDGFENTMKGSEKAGKSLMTFKKYNPATNKEETAWQVEAIDNKIKDGQYIEDSQEASSHLLFALDLDSSLVGAGPGKKMGEGSGSDKRVAYNMHILNTKPHQDIILDPLNFISDYNGWGVTFWFRNYLIATQDVENEKNRA